MRSIPERQDMIDNDDGCTRSGEGRLEIASNLILLQATGGKNPGERRRAYGFGNIQSLSMVAETKKQGFNLCHLLRLSVYLSAGNLVKRIQLCRRAGLARRG
jgi:hypothetical protein